MTPSDWVSTDDAAAVARAKLAPEAWDFIDGGAGAERTVRANIEAFNTMCLRPRVLRDVSAIDTRTSLPSAGDRALAAPLLVAPTAPQTLAHPGGESATAAAATELGLVMVASVMSDHRIEQITAAATEPGRIWQQLYLFRDRHLTADLVARAEDAGVGGLVVTVDSPWLGRRPRNLRNRFRIPAHISAGHLGASLPATPDFSSPAAFSSTVMDHTLTYADIENLTKTTRLPLWVKGILRAEDAKGVIDAGAAGVIVSNHGGRQLDRAIATICALPDVVQAAGDVPVLLDGGIRSGVDAAIALALGARAVLIGRPTLWGLAAAGQAGVHAVLSLLIEELTDAMGQTGCARLSDLDSSLIARSGQ